MSKELIAALDALEKENGISKEVMFEAIEKSLMDEYKTQFNTVENGRVVLDRITGDFHIYSDRQVVEEVSVPEPAEGSRPSWFGFLLSVREESGLDRNKVTRYIEDHNIQTRLLFSGNLIKHPCFDQIRGTDAYRVVGDLETTDFVMTHTFWVGVYPGMTDEKIDYMAQIIKEAVNQ